MKKLVFMMAFVCQVASAEAVRLASVDKDKQEWYGYGESFVRYSDGYSILIGKREPGMNEDRHFVGISRVDCQKKFGTLRFRKNENDNWSDLSTVSMLPPITVSDTISSVLCEVGLSGEKPAPKTVTKPVTKNKT